MVAVNHGLQPLENGFYWHSLHLIFGVKGDADDEIGEWNKVIVKNKQLAMAEMKARKWDVDSADVPEKNAAPARRTRIAQQPSYPVEQRADPHPNRVAMALESQGFADEQHSFLMPALRR